MLSAMEEELELGRAYVQGPLAPGLELKLGRQVVVWGRSDLFGGLTPFNGHDQRDPGMYGPRDTLLPAAMARLSLAHAPWDLALVFQPEFRYDKLPPYGSDFYPFDFPPPAREEAGWGLGDAGWGLRLARDFTACSLALIGAAYSRERDLVGLDRAGDQRPLDRLWLAGLSGDLAQGSLVFKLDSALIHGLTFYQLPGETKTRLDFTAGVDYSGLADTFLGLEATYRYLFGPKRRPGRQAGHAPPPHPGPGAQGLTQLFAPEADRGLHRVYDRAGRRQRRRPEAQPHLQAGGRPFAYRWDARFPGRRQLPLPTYRRQRPPLPETDLPFLASLFSLLAPAGPPGSPSTGHAPVFRYN